MATQLLELLAYNPSQRKQSGLFRRSIPGLFFILWISLLLPLQVFEFGINLNSPIIIVLILVGLGVTANVVSQAFETFSLFLESVFHRILLVPRSISTVVFALDNSRITSGYQTASRTIPVFVKTPWVQYNRTFSDERELFGNYFQGAINRDQWQAVRVAAFISDSFDIDRLNDQNSKDLFPLLTGMLRMSNINRAISYRNKYTLYRTMWSVSFVLLAIYLTMYLYLFYGEIIQPASFLLFGQPIDLVDTPFIFTVAGGTLLGVLNIFFLFLFLLFVVRYRQHKIRYVEYLVTDFYIAFASEDSE